MGRMGDADATPVIHSYEKTKQDGDGAEEAEWLLFVEQSDAASFTLSALFQARDSALSSMYQVKWDRQCMEQHVR